MENDKTENNYAFIDGHNLYLNIKQLGWELDYTKFRQYLLNKYAVKKAYIFLGYMFENVRSYLLLENAGFVLVFKEAIRKADGTIKGNCDIEMSVRVCIDFWKFDKAIIVTGDGDFLYLVHILRSTDKLLLLIAPNKTSCSYLYQRHLPERFISYLSDQKVNLGM